MITNTNLDSNCKGECFGQNILYNKMKAFAFFFKYISLQKILIKNRDHQFSKFLFVAYMSTGMSEDTFTLDYFCLENSFIRNQKR
jgi:hypothetical protein